VDAPTPGAGNDEVVTGARRPTADAGDDVVVTQAPRRAYPEGAETLAENGVGEGSGEGSSDRETIGAQTDRETVGEHAHEAAENPLFAENEIPANSEIPGSELTVLPAVPRAEEREGVSLPTHSTRGTAPGLRGCWAVNKSGDPCAAARRADSDYCNAHSGYGVAKDPAKWAVIGAAKNNEIRRRRAAFRLALGPTRLGTPRGLLKAAVFAQGEAVVEAALSPITDSTAPSGLRHSAALALLREVEPMAQVTVSQPLPDDPEGVDEMSLSALLQLAEAHGLRTTRPLPASDQP
jgi:hypothetical protein